MNVKKIIFSIVVFLTLSTSATAQVKFVGDSKYSVFEEKPSASTGLNNIYVLYSTNGVKMQYVADNSSAKVSWYRFGETGGAYAEPLAVVKNGNVTTLENIIPNSGYIIEENDRRYYCWVVNYADYYLDLNSLNCENDGDCGSVTLNISGVGKDISYYTINGGRKVLDRNVELSYMNLEWRDGEMTWVQTRQVESFDGLENVVTLPAPFCNSQFELSGDRFLKLWGEEQHVSSEVYTTNAVAVKTFAKQENEAVSNQSGANSEDGALGGSAPVTILFSAYCTDAVAQKEWQMSYDMEFNEIENRYMGEEITQVIEESGITYWRFVGTNASGECAATSDVYTVNVGESSLQCPNAFSPGVSEGVNDEWKVSYKSIVRFKCNIFNTWGVQMCELNDPSQGWDGKFGGKFVKPGVYYYVIEAEGSEGKIYRLKGDINIVGQKSSTENSMITE